MPGYSHVTVALVCALIPDIRLLHRKLKYIYEDLLSIAS